MKSATTSLYRWLDEQPEVFMAHPKETRLLLGRLGPGPDWYSNLFADAVPGQMLGEASVNYSNPEPRSGRGDAHGRRSFRTPA